MSGLDTPSWVGPRLENAAVLSSVRSLLSCTFAAPTVSTKGSSAGLLIVPLSGPRLPAATTTNTPANQSCSTA
jgi:hypothetical protein